MSGPRKPPRPPFLTYIPGATLFNEINARAERSRKNNEGLSGRSPPQRTKGKVGAPPKLTEDQITRGQQMVRENPKLWRDRDAAANYLLGVFKLKDKVHPETIKRLIIRPALHTK